MSSSFKVKMLAFNQDFTCLAVAGKSGYKIYNCDPFGLCYGSDDGSFTIVEMLFCTSLLALVGSGEQATMSPRRLQMVNTKRQSLICEFNYSDSICSVKMNRKFLAVSLRSFVYLYDISSMTLIHTIDLVGDGGSGVLALTTSSQDPQSLLAYPSGTSVGEVILFNVDSLKPINAFPAHKSPISCLSFNSDSSLLASCSDKGTVIRVYRLPDCTKVMQLRRGNIPAAIYSLSFSPNGRFLCASSDSTVHIFSMAGLLSENQRKSISSFFPGLINEVLEPSRDFARIKLPNASLNITAFNHESNQIYLVTRDGHFYQYQFDEINGGECDLSKQYRIM